MINLEGSPNSYIVAAYHEHISIKIRCCVEIGEFYYVVDAKGHINDINGMNAQYVVQDVKILLDPVSKDNNRASFSFILKNIQNRDKLINANIIGEAFINKTTHDAAGNLRSLLLQFPRKYTVRPIRSSKRYVLKENINHFFKVVLPAEIPKTRTGLVNLLREPSEYITDNARIVNLSRGGACICLPEELARPLLSSGTMYVVFFAPANVGTQDNTYLFVAKHLGLGRANCPSGVPVRMEFASELDTAKFTWRDIHEKGSERLQAYLEQYESEIPPDPKWDAG